MPRIYGTLVVAKPRTQGENLTEELVNLVRQWVSSWYSWYHHIGVDVPARDGQIEPLPTHRIEVTDHRITSGEELWKLDWDYPDPTDPSVEFQVDCTVATTPAGVEFGLGLSRESREYRLAPSPFELKRPTLVKQVVERFDCWSGPSKVGCEPLQLDAESIPRFVADELLNSSRTLPVVVVTRPNIGIDYLVDPGSLADALCGFGLVFVIPDRTGSFALKDLLGQKLCCYNGSIRIYWPSFAVTDNPRLHPLYAPETIGRMLADGLKLEEVVFSRLCAISAFRFVAPPQASAIRRTEIEEGASRLTSEFDELRKRAEAEGMNRETLLARIRALEQLERDRARTVRSLERENQRLRAVTDRANAASETHEDDLGPLATEGVSESLPETVEEAVLRARTEFGDYLEILRSAIDSAERSHSRHSKETYRGLEAIREVAHDYFVGIDTKRGLGETMERAFRRRGFNYASKDSLTTRGKFGAQRTFSFNGTPTLFEQHLTIGGGDRQDPVQIYFLTDHSSRRFVVGYCGMHLEIVRGAS